MSINRRYFIKDSILAAGAFFLPTTANRMANWALNAGQPQSLLAGAALSGLDPHVLTVYHTAHHEGLIPSASGMQHLRSERNGLLLDAGNFLSKDATGEQHIDFIRAMNQSGYHAAALGHTELDMDTDQMQELAAHMHFPLICANINVGNSPLAGHVKPYLILPYGSYKIGITGVADRPLRSQTPYGYKHPGESLTQVAAHLRQEGCQLVICLSGMTHLSDQVRLAKSVTGVDLIVSANKASFQSGPYIAKDAADEEVAVSQGCFNGSYLRHLNLSLQTAGVQFPA